MLVFIVVGFKNLLDIVIVGFEWGIVGILWGIVWVLFE